MPRPSDAKGRTLVGYVPGGRISEPLREGNPRQLERLMACVAALPSDSVTWVVETREGRS